MSTTTDVKLHDAREAVRTALDRYALALAMASDRASDNERADYRKSEAQVESAKRVLWMDN